MAIRGRKRSRGSEPATPADGSPDDLASRMPRLHELPGMPRDPAAEIDIDAEEARAAQYNDWAERLRDKRRVAQERQRQYGQAASATPTTEPTYWTTDALFEESRRVDGEEQLSRPDPARVQELLAVLELEGRPSSDAIADAYRRLAKTHHPDRFALADEATQIRHAARMRAVIDAYSALKTLELCR